MCRMWCTDACSSCSDFEQVRLLESILRECIVPQDNAELPVEDLQKAIKFHLHRQQKCLEITMAEVFDLVTKVFPQVKRKRNKRKNVYPLLQSGFLLLLYNRAAEGLWLLLLFESPNGLTFTWWGCCGSCF